MEYQYTEGVNCSFMQLLTNPIGQIDKYFLDCSGVSVATASGSKCCIETLAVQSLQESDQNVFINIHVDRFKHTVNLHTLIKNQSPILHIQRRSVPTRSEHTRLESQPGPRAEAGPSTFQRSELSQRVLSNTRSCVRT